MTIFNMAIKNIKSNFKNYWAYFLSSTFSIFALYLFLSMLYSQNIQSQLGGDKRFTILFNQGAVMIALFSAFFMWYSNTFFIKSRKKEFATYMLLGMSKKQVARLNFLENAVIIILSLATGIILGVIFTKFFIMLLFFIMRSNAFVPFQWSVKALKICLIVFGLIFMFITLHGTAIIMHNDLINLFTAAKKVEKGLKVSFFTVILGILSIVAAGSGYYIAMKKLPTDFTKAPIVIALVVIGAILFFTSATSVIIYMNKKNEKKLFSGTKLISVSQLYSRYRGNTGTLITIAITTTIALCALVTCIGMYTKNDANSRYMRPMSVEYYNTNNADKIFNNVLKKHSEISVKSKDSIQMLDTGVVDPLSKVKQDFYIINQSQFNKINKHEGKTRNVNLKSDNDCYFIQEQTYMTSDTPLNKNINVNIGSKNYTMKIKGTDVIPFVAMDHFKETIVVNDNVYNEMKINAAKAKLINISGYILKNNFAAKNFAAELQKDMTKSNYLLTFYELYYDGLKLLGTMAFIGLFIGILFIMSTGSIIYFKMSMEAREDKSKYVTLSKIGVSKKEIKNAVSKQLLLLFGAPLIFAIVSAYPAAFALGKMLTFELVRSYIGIVIVYAVVYCLYYIITLNSYMKTISE